MTLFRLALLTFFGFALISCTPEQEAPPEAEAQPSEEELIAKARGIHDRVITLDTHIDFNLDYFTTDKNYTMDLDSQVTLPKLDAGGLDVSFLIVYTRQEELNAEGFEKAHKQAMAKFDAIHRLTKEYAPEQIELALNSDDVRRIVAAGKKVAMIGVENGYPVGEDIGNVKKFADLGARYMSLSHNGHSQLCDSNTGERDDVWLHNGLSDLGKQVIAEMNKWGMMIDLSHPSKLSNLQTLELSKAPVIASHSSARALCNHSRNLDDEELMKIKENGGVVQTVAFSGYLVTDKHNAHREARDVLYKSIADEMNFEILSWGEIRELDDEARQAYRENYNKVRELAKPRMADEVNAKAPPVDVGDFIDHVDYLVKTIGLDHVGISSDFDGGGGIHGWMDASETFNVTLELVRRGYTEEQISQLWSGNLLRVLDEVQAVAKRLQAEEAGE